MKFSWLNFDQFLPQILVLLTGLLNIYVGQSKIEAGDLLL